MKVLFLLALICGSALAAPPSRDTKPAVKSLIDDLLDFVALIPVDKLLAITDQHLKDDGEFCDVVRYLQGNEWAALVAEVDSKPAVQDFKEYLRDAGLPVDVILGLIHELIANAKPEADSSGSSNLRSYLDEIEAALPLDDLKALLNDKMENSADFQALYEKVSSEKAHALVEEVRALDEVQRIAQRLKDMGVRVDEVLATVYEFLGWGAPVKSLRSLIDDLLEFLALIPVEELLTIVNKHLKEDGEFCDVVRYLQSDEWHALVEEIGSKQAVQDFKKYLNDAGLPVDLIIKFIHEAIEGAKPEADSTGTSNLRAFLDEAEAALPIDELKALLEYKMQYSPDFQALYEKVSSEKAHALVEEVRAIKEVQRLAQELKNMGVKVDEVLAEVYEFLGWGTPVRHYRH